MLDENALAALTDSHAVGQSVPDTDAVDRGFVPQSENSDPEFPSWIWTAMFACYGLFFAGMILATGRDAEAIFMIIISAAYTLMYFGTASILFSLHRGTKTSEFARGRGSLQTYTGPMSIKAVVGQVLIIPISLAFFAFAVTLIRAIVF